MAAETRLPAPVFGLGRGRIPREAPAGAAKFTVDDPVSETRYRMRQPLWRRLLDSMLFVRGVFGCAIFLWVILRITGVLDLWDLVTILLVLFGLSTAYDVGVRHPVGWLIASTGVVVQVTHVDAFSGGARAGLWIAYVIVALGILWRAGALSPQRTVRLRGWQDSRVPLTHKESTLYAQGDVRRGEITCQFCDVVVDLRRADITRPPAILNVSCVAGRVDVVVPAWWRVSHNVSTTLAHIVLEARLTGLNTGPKPSTWVSPMRPIGELKQGFRNIGEPDPDAGFLHLLVQGSSRLGSVRIRHA